MSEPVFQVLQSDDSGIYGKQIYSGSTDIMEGHLVKYSSGSQVLLCQNTNIPVGFARGLRMPVYAPTSRYYDSGEALALTRGDGVVAASSDFFVSGTLPTPNQAVYAGAGGLMTVTAGSDKLIGKCIRQEVRVEGTGGTGTSQTLAVVWFNIHATMT
jgi:hypothetical protein